MRYLLASLVIAGCASAGEPEPGGMVDARKVEVDAAFGAYSLNVRIQ